MVALDELPADVSAAVMHWVVPLAMAWNILSCVGLAAREEERLKEKPKAAELVLMRRTVTGAWLLGLVAGAVGVALTQGLWGTWSVRESRVDAHEWGWLVISGLLGLGVGIARGCLTRTEWYRKISGVGKRRLLSLGVGVSVAITTVCLIEYRAECAVEPLYAVMASFYLMLVLGYAFTCLEVW